MMSSWVIATRIAWASLPESRDWRLALARFGGTPLMSALLYFVVSSAGAGSDRQGDAVAAAIGAGASGASVSIAVLVASDRFEGTLPFLLIGSSRGPGAWWGRSVVLVGLGIAMAMVGAVIPIASAGGFDETSKITSVAVAFIAIAPASAGVGLLLGAASLRLRDSLVLASAAEFLLPLTVGVVSPLSALPEWLEFVLRVNPVADVIDAARIAASEGFTSSYWSDLRLACLLAIVWAGVASALWWYLARSVRRSGTADALAAG